MLLRTGQGDAGSRVRKFSDRLALLATNPHYRRWVRQKLLGRIGYSFEHWARIAQNRAWTAFLAARPDANMLEISPGPNKAWSAFGSSYAAVQFPEFDICREWTAERYDIIIADNVFEHLEKPYAAGRNVHQMLNPGGWFLIATPFLIRIHGHPHDFTRWTADGLRNFLAECGFENVTVSAWGNRACVAANFSKWAEFGWFRPMRNEPEFPVTVWAFAQKTRPS